MKQHILPIRVYYEDTDAGGIVYHSNYLNFFERARTESLRSMGFELVKLYKDMGIHFVVRKAEVEFLRAASLDQLLYVISEISEVRHASIMYNQRIHLESVEGPMLCTAKIKLACLDSQLRPRGLPNYLLTEMKK